MTTIECFQYDVKTKFCLLDQLLSKSISWMLWMQHGKVWVNTSTHTDTFKYLCNNKLFKLWFLLIKHKQVFISLAFFIQSLDFKYV